MNFIDILKSGYFPIICMVIIVAAVSFFKEYKNLKKSANEDAEKLPYRKKYLLTKNEYGFYKNLKEIADKYGYAVLAKIRFADLVEVNSEAGKANI